LNNPVSVAVVISGMDQRLC